ncbi:type I-E CRISPR-associated protein Cse2/CasB [Streptomyces sparsogenes]|uniref:CRISPR-associated protein, Cse2 family n=1 Tax=Streptomyces sparsogenes DSM 40356 TaxID=1331668 RepID=A0A1R1SHY6_9ACTN|nr:type I-E CRISPR-associated protein Cse2/CasB [Streptomyces sparsogenes]OMI37902.1 CRISPR-associated protein, Cse2 family [Streptomyces sparsogenes DSM 40356]
MTTSHEAPSALPAQRRKPLGPVGTTVAAHIQRLQQGYRQDRPDAVATLARIRRGAGKSAGALPDLWGLTGTEQLYAGITDWPETRTTQAEEAVHIAVTLWALHQQSHRGADMHVPAGPELGSAVRRLMPDGELDEPIRKRFVRAGTASSVDILAQRLRELVLLLRRGAIPLDYGLLSDQLFRWQQPEGQAEIHRSWGRSFHAYRPPNTEKAKKPDTTATDKDLS